MKALQAIVLICFLLSVSHFELAYSQAAVAGLQISPSSIDFGENPVDSDAPPQTVSVTNSSPSTITFVEIIASGIDFAEKHDCGQTLAPGAQCTIQVSFTPAISGPRTGNLEIMGTDGNPHFVALSGVGK